METVVFTDLATTCLRTRQRAEEKSAGFSTLHLLEEILAQPECNAHKALVAQGLRTDALLSTLSRYSDKNPTVEPAMRTTMEQAVELVAHVPDVRVGTDHLLLALMANETSRGGFVLKQLGLGGPGLVDIVRQMERER